MATDVGWRFYVALVASGVSTVAWIAALAAVIGTGYFSVTDGPAATYARWTILALVVAIAFAQVEKRLYRIDRDD